MIWYCKLEHICISLYHNVLTIHRKNHENRIFANESSEYCYSYIYSSLSIWLYFRHEYMTVSLHFSSFFTQSLVFVVSCSFGNYNSSFINHRNVLL